MNRENIIEILNQFIIEVKGDQNLRLNEFTNLKDSSDKESIGLSSIEMVDFFIKIEDRFHIEISGEEAVKFRVTKDIIDYIENDYIA